MIIKLSKEEMLKRVARLSRRDVDYLRLLLIGSSDREIALGMKISTRTAKQYTLKLRNTLFGALEMPKGPCSVRIALAVRISQIMLEFPLIAETLHHNTRPADWYTVTEGQIEVGLPWPGRKLPFDGHLGAVSS